MIDPALANAFARIGARQADLLHAYQPGFEPNASDTATRTPQRADSHDPLCVAAPEGAYFISPGNDGSRRLTRDGAFRFIDGELRSSDGRPALGFASGERGEALVRLHVDPVDAALGRVANPRIEADGTVFYTRSSVDPRGGGRRIERVALGRLALARLPAGTQPVRRDATHVGAPAGVAPLLGVPLDGAFGALATHARDLGRVDPAAGLQRLQEAYLAFDALQAANHARHSSDKTTMDLVK